MALLVGFVSPPLVPSVGLELAPSSHTTCLTAGVTDISIHVTNLSANVAYETPHQIFPIINIQLKNKITSFLQSPTGVLTQLA